MNSRDGTWVGGGFPPPPLPFPFLPTIFSFVLVRPPTVGSVFLLSPRRIGELFCEGLKGGELDLPSSKTIDPHCGCPHYGVFFFLLSGFLSKKRIKDVCGTLFWGGGEFQHGFDFFFFCFCFFFFFFVFFCSSFFFFFSLFFSSFFFFFLVFT